jgi:hypothetical protein
MTTKIVWMCDFFQACNITGSGLATLVVASLVSIKAAWPLWKWFKPLYHTHWKYQPHKKITNLKLGNGVQRDNHNHNVLLLCKMILKSKGR